MLLKSGLSISRRQTQDWPVFMRGDEPAENCAAALNFAIKLNREEEERAARLLGLTWQMRDLSVTNERAVVQLGHCLAQFFLRVHDDGSVPCYRLFKRLAGD